MKKSIITLNRNATYKDFQKPMDERFSPIEVEIREKAKSLAEDALFNYFIKLGNALDMVKEIESCPKDINVYDYMVKIYFRHQRNSMKFYNLEDNLNYIIMRKKLYMLCIMNKYTIGEKENMDGRINVCAESLYKSHTDMIVQYYAMKEMKGILKKKAIQLYESSMSYIDGYEDGRLYKIKDELQRHLELMDVESLYNGYAHTFNYFLKKQGLYGKEYKDICFLPSYKKAEKDFNNEYNWRFL